VGKNAGGGADFLASGRPHGMGAGELSIWGTLMVFTTVRAVALLANVWLERASPSDSRLPSIESHP
jgi:hypothetical protein